MRYLFMFLLLTTTLLQANTLYQWIDEEGVTHYTQTPPPSYVGAEERIIDLPKPEPQAEQTTNPQDPLESLKQTRAQNCQKARDNLAILISDQEVFRTREGTDSETGEAIEEQEIMTIEQRQQEIAKTQNFIEQFCQQAEETELQE